MAVGTGGLRQSVLLRTPLARLGARQDAAGLVGFLCPPRGRQNQQSAPIEDPDIRAARTS